MYKAIIFDFFGVIRGEAYESWLDKRGLKREGVFLDVVRAMDSGVISMEDFLQTLSQEVGDTPETILKEINGGAIINEDVVSIIQDLRTNYSIGLLSNASMAIIKPLLRDHNLTELFDEVVVSSDVGHIKPYPEIFEIMLDRLGVVANEAVFIDDSKSNVDGAAAVGIVGLVFTGAVTLREDLGQLEIQ